MADKNDKWSVSLDRYDRGILINMLNDCRSDKIKNGESTEIVDDLLLKVILSKQRAKNTHEDR